MFTFIHPPGRPFALQNCTMERQSPDSSVQVDCIESFDGGLPQGFLLELVEVPSLRLVRNMSLLVRATEKPIHFIPTILFPTLFTFASVYCFLLESKLPHLLLIKIPP